MATKSNQRVRITKRLFHENLLALLKEKPIEKISVKELCDRAELNRTTFYLHYGKPEDVLEEIENDLIHDIQMFIVDTEQENKPTTMLEMLLSYIKNNREMFDLLVFKYGRDQFRQTCMERIMPLVFASNYGIIPQENALYVGSYIAAGSFAILYTWALNGYDRSEQDIMDLLIQINDYRACHK